MSAASVSFLHRLRPRLVGLVWLIVLAGITNPAIGQTPTDTWSTATNGVWSGAGNWLGGSAPPSGGDPARVLQFGIYSGQSSYTATNDLGNPFVLNGIRFEGNSASQASITLTSATNNAINFAGTAPFILQNGSAANGISAAVISTTLTIGGTGTGTLGLFGVLSGGPGGAADAIDVNTSGGFYFQPVGYAEGNVLQLTGSNTFSGAVRLINGNLLLGKNASLGASTNPLIVDGATATLQSNSSTLNIPNPITANATVTVLGTNGGTFTGGIAGPGGLYVTASAAIALTAANGYTGDTVIGTPGLTSTAGLTLSGGGTLTSTASLTFHSGATLTLTNTATANSTDRVADGVALQFHNAQISFTAAPGLVSGETFGPVTASGLGVLTTTASSTAGSTSTLAFGALTRVDNATFYVRTANSGQTIGGGTPAANRTNITFAGGLTGIADPLGPVGGLNLPIVPFISGSLAGTSSTAASALATYDGNGIQFLSATDSTVFKQITSPTGFAYTPHVNNNIAVASSAMTLTGTATVNALSSSTNGSLSGTGTLQVVSGAVLVAGSLGLSGPTLAFGNTTGYFHLGGNVGFSGTGNITGTAGVVVSSDRASGSSNFNLTNSAANSFSGGLYVNGTAQVVFTRDDQLGAAGGEIILNGGMLRYPNTGSATIDPSRTIRLGPSGGILQASISDGTGTLVVGSAITGPGGLQVNWPSDTVIVTGPTSYSGPTVVSNSSNLQLLGPSSGTGMTFVNSGTLSFTDESSLPSGQLVVAGGSKLHPLTSATISHDVFCLQSQCTFQIDAGLTATLNGRLVGDGIVGKSGNGTLVITGDNPLTGALTISTGTVLLTGNGRFGRSSSVGGGGLLRLDYTAGAADRIGDTTTLSVGGEVRCEGGPTPVTEAFGALKLGGGIVTLLPGAGANMTLNASSVVTSLPTLIRGDNLGGTSGQSSNVFIGGVADGTVMLKTLADTTATGTGQEQAVYSTTVGVRLATLSDYTTGPTLQNSAGTPTTADFRVTGATSTVGAANTIRSLRLDAGSTLDASSGTLTVSTNYVFVPACGSATVTGGTLSPLSVLALGDLTIGSRISGSSLSKYGPGTLTLNGTLTVSSITIAYGNLVLNNGLTNTFSQIGSPAGLGILSPTAGGIVLNTPTTTLNLTDTNLPTISNPISGTGQVTYTPASASTLTFAASNSFSGGLIGTANAYFATQTATGLGTGPVTLAGGTSSVPTGVSFNTGTATIQNVFQLPTSGGVIQLSSGTSTSTVTLSGKVTGGSPAGTSGEAVIQFYGSTIELANPANDFKGRLVVNGAVLGVVSDAALGNPSNIIDMGVTGSFVESTLRFDADGVTISRPIRVLSSYGYFDSQSYTGRLAGTITTNATVAKIGTGTLILDSPISFASLGNEFYLNGGTLVVNNTVTPAPGTSAINVTNSTLRGTGAVAGEVDMFGTSVLASGTPTAPGKLSLAGLQLFAATTMSFRLNGPGVGNGVSAGGYDELVYQGSSPLILYSSSLSASIGGGYDPTQTETPIFIIDNQNGSAVTGTFTGLPNNAIVNLGGYTAQISYFGDTATQSITGGNDVVLYNFQAVPEPSTFLLLAAFGVGGLVRLRRRTC
jgi:autotransporter-associated beta strand protein